MNMNICETENRGFEIGANARVVDTKDFKFNVGLTIGHYRNEVTSLPNGSFTTEVCGGTVLTEVGQPAGVFYGYVTDGVLDDGVATACHHFGLI